MTTLITLAFLKQIGIGDKYIQQREEDQVVAYQKAFTLELAYTMIFFVVVAIALPLYALVIYDRPEILAPGFVLSLTLIATAFQTPTWIFYRRLDYFRQRSIEIVDPLVTTVAMIGLLIAGFEAVGPRRRRAGRERGGRDRSRRSPTPTRSGSAGTAARCASTSSSPGRSSSAASARYSSCRAR